LANQYIKQLDFVRVNHETQEQILRNYLHWVPNTSIWETMAVKNAGFPIQNLKVL